jgi:hypothetical protein
MDAVQPRCSVLVCGASHTYYFYTTRIVLGENLRDGLSHTPSKNAFDSGDHAY